MVAEQNAIIRLCELTDERYAGIKKCLDELLTVLKSMDARLKALEHVASIGVNKPLDRSG